MGNVKNLIVNLLQEENVFQRRLGVASLVTKAFTDKKLNAPKATADQDSREWALRMMAGMYSEIDWSFLHRSAHSLGILKEAEDLQREIKRYWDKFTELTNAKINEDID